MEMGRTRLIGLCLVAMLVLVAINVAGASAEVVSPEIGRCVKKATVAGAGYSDGACTHAVASNAHYEWVPGAGPQPGFTLKQKYVFPANHGYCERALYELSLAAEERAEAALAGEPEAREKIHDAQIHEAVAEEKLRRAHESAEGCENALKSEQSKIPVELQTVKGVTVECGVLEGSGEYTGAQSLGGLSIKLGECSMGPVDCSTAGASEGEILTSTLDGTLGTVAKPELGVAAVAGVALHPAVAGANVAEFSCGGTAVVVTGSAVHKVEANESLLTETFQFTEAKGVQHPEGFVEALEPSVLMASIGGGAPEQAGLDVKALQTNTEKMEVRTLS
jgi:hypothetical protein